MATTKIGDTDTYEVTDFVLSMPHLRYQVTFIKGKARVTAREGCTTHEWDRHAIGAVEQALVLGGI